MAQEREFSDTYDAFKNNTKARKTGPLDKLRPIFIDGTICLGGRVQNKLDGCNADPILHSNSPVTKLIIQHYHEMYGHTGASQVLSSLRERF